MGWPVDSAIAIWAAAVVCLLGIGLGLLGLFAPDAAARIVRLQADPAFPDGRAEFRASFGGLFVAVHVGALVVMLPDLGHAAPGAAGITAAAMAALLWLGTAHRFPGAHGVSGGGGRF
jgi:hypothetical protein